MPVLKAKKPTKSKAGPARVSGAASVVVKRPVAVPSRGAVRAEQWDFDTVMRKLERLGTAQNRKVYPRHGATGEIFGVSFANLNELAKRIRTDHDLAEELWLSGNFDAQNLAAKVADPARLDDAGLDRWARQVKNYGASMMLGGVAARSAAALTRFNEWSTSREEFTLAVAYDMLAAMLKNEAAVDDALLFSVLDRIEGQIHTAPNRARYSMLTALIAIGGYRENLRATALAAARRIGPVHVDHGQTDCKTPDAVAYIGKMVAHATVKKAKAKRR